MTISTAITFQTAMQQISGLSFIYETLPVHSPLGRKKLMDTPFCTDKNIILKELDLTTRWIAILEMEEHNRCIEKLAKNLSQLHDISHTISNLASQKVLDDIQLFEVKKFAILTENVITLLEEVNFSLLDFSSLEEVIRILDPEQKRIPHFYIYAEYSSEIAKKRSAFSQEKNPDKKEALFIEITHLEDQIRADLSQKLFPFSEVLSANLQYISSLDLSLAKALQSMRLKLKRPEIVDEKTCLKGLFHPEIKSLLQSQLKNFQPIDIDLKAEPLLITGANMSGKTVLLKSLALTQTLAQFGFYVPAQQASLVLVEEIMLSIGEQNREMDGLSSFATEILTIDAIVKRVKKGTRVLVLVDELARTTNPEEGKRIVKAFIEIMRHHNSCAVITTHYAGIETPVRRLRVKGLQITENATITPENINEYIDYSLLETQEDDVPEEAIRIAEILGVDEELLRIARG